MAAGTSRRRYPEELKARAVQMVADLRSEPPRLCARLLLREGCSHYGEEVRREVQGQGESPRLHQVVAGELAGGRVKWSV